MTLRDADVQNRLAKAATLLNESIASMASALSGEVHSLSQEILRIEALEPRSEEDDRERALRSHSAQVIQMDAQLEQIRAGTRFGVLGAPVQAFMGFRDLRRAKAKHAEAARVFDAPDLYRQRSKEIGTHNQYIANEHARLVSLQASLGTSKTGHATVTRFREDAAEAIAAALGDGWIGPDFVERFCAMVEEVKACNIGAASAYLLTLAFQRQPAMGTYERWCQEAVDVRQRAYSKYSGMAASGAYPEIVGRSIQLTHSALREKPLRAMKSHLHTADQWQILSVLLTNPHTFKVDALWAVYWSMFQCAEWAAAALSETEVHEDVFTGKLTAQIDRWLADWATERVRQFGYPDTRSYMGTLEIASTDEETRLGADLGLIIDLNIGGLTCRKVALFQAKKTKHGVADVGSGSGQLPKLVARPRIGFYLFYHQSQYPLHSPAPTICSAQALAECVLKMGKRTDATSLRVNVRPLGWDWASFVSFGLCEPTSDLGETFDSVEEALSLLGDGNGGHLPKYLHVIAIADEPRVMALRERVHENYLDAIKTKEKSYTRSRNQSKERDGPEHGMAF